MTRKKKQAPVAAPNHDSGVVQVWVDESPMDPQVQKEILGDLLLAEEPATTVPGSVSPAVVSFIPDGLVPSARVLSVEERILEKIKIIDERLLALELAHAKTKKPQAICVQEPSPSH